MLLLSRKWNSKTIDKKKCKIYKSHQKEWWTDFCWGAVFMLRVWMGEGPHVGCRLKFHYFVACRLKFSTFVGCRYSQLIFCRWSVIFFLVLLVVSNIFKPFVASRLTPLTPSWLISEHWHSDARRKCYYFQTLKIKVPNCQVSVY